MQGARGFFNGHESGALEITIRSWTTANVACGIFRWVFRDTSVNIDGSHRSDSRILFRSLKRALNIFHRRMDVIGYACTQLSLVGWEWKLAVMQIVITLGACWIRTWGHGVESSLRWRKLFNLKNKLPSLYQRQNQSYFRWQTNQRADLWNLDQFLSTDKVHIFWEGHKILQNFHLTFDCMYCSQK